jgi:death on curing protein
MDGLRDEGLLELALDRPNNFFGYGERDLRVLAAIYAQGISQNHAFLDGNKRTAYSVSGLFLHVNGLRLEIPSLEKQIAFFKNLAAGKVSFDELTLFYKKNSKKKKVS